MWFVIWLVLMLFWLFGGGYYVYNGPSPNAIAFGAGTLLPWVCVLLAGLQAFGIIHSAHVQF